MIKAHKCCANRAHLSSKKVAANERQREARCLFDKCGKFNHRKWLLPLNSSKRSQISPSLFSSLLSSHSFQLSISIHPQFALLASRFFLRYLYSSSLPYHHSMMRTSSLLLFRFLTSNLSISRLQSRALFTSDSSKSVRLLLLQIHWPAKVIRCLQPAIRPCDCCANIAPKRLAMKCFRGVDFKEYDA